MIIAVDGYEANVENRVGIGEYALRILHGIHDILEKRKDTSTLFRIYLPQNPLKDLPSETAYWKYIRSYPPKLWTYIGLPARLLLDSPKPSVVFSPTHYIPRIQVAPQVMSVMDLSYLTYPDLFRPKDLYQLREWTAYGVKRSKKILTISEFSRNAIIEAYKIPQEQVVVTYPGLRLTTVTSMESKESVLKKYGITGQYILSVGTIQPRKNYETLIRTFALSKKQKPEIFKGVTLVIVGKKGWMYESILAAPEKYGVRESVTFLDFVPDEDLAVLYQQAVTFVLISLYEGFGLPVLEAMANKCQVIISNLSSLPEIAGGCGIVVDPAKDDEISDAIVQAVSEYGGPVWKKRIEKGLLQSAQFSWEKAAEQTLAVLESIGKGAT